MQLLLYSFLQVRQSCDAIIVFGTVNAGANHTLLGDVFEYFSKEKEIGDLKTQSGFSFLQSCMSFLTADKFMLDTSQQFSAALGQEICY